MIEQHIFNNRYRLDDKLGEGGMATVFSGTDTLLRRRVAVKVLRAQYAADEEFVRRFYQEAESAAKLNHPNVVNTYDVGREGDTYFIVMELVDGPSLAEVIAADGKLPEPVAIDYAAQVCNGLAYAHRQGLLHRDIKPANILVTKDDVVKLSDFGIARAVSQQTMAMTKPGLVMGSVFYLSPEQAQGHELHESSDLYSVGVVLYQMLTGKVPYGGESPVTVALKHIGDPVPTLDTAELGVSPALAAIVNKLLQKNPQSRFASASDVASALREARERPTHAAFDLSDDSPTQAFAIPTPPPRPSRLPDRGLMVEAPAQSRRRGMLVGIALVAALIFASIVGYFILGHGAPPALSPAIDVANYKNLSDAQAQRAIVNAGLKLAPIKYTPSDTVSANHVISQNPEPGAKVPKDTAVQIIVSNGLPTIGLGDFRGYTFADAQKDLLRDLFRVQSIHRYAGAPKDTVVGEEPAAGKHVRQGSNVLLIVSDGPKPVQIPNLVGMKMTAANTLAGREGFVLNVTQRASFDNIPADSIASQDIDPGTNVVPHTDKAVVNVVVSTGGGQAAVPNVSAADPQSAERSLQQAGFQPAIKYMIDPGSSQNGQIVDQSPVAAAQAQKGSPVTITLSVPGEVPDTDGMSVGQARTVLLNAGYQVGNTTYTTEGANGNVVRTEPFAGTSLRPGETVTLIVNKPGGTP